MQTKTAIITGGSRGIGRSACIALAKQGFNIVVNYSANAAAAEDTAIFCREIGAKALAVQGDVSKYSDCEAIFKCAIDAFGAVHLLINNAGITRDNILARMSESDFDDVISINLKGVFNMMKVVSRPMMKQRGGKIINLSSVVGIMGNAGQINYAASKAGVIGMTKSLARELAPYGVNVNAIAPGFIKTDMTSNLPESVAEKFCASIPMGHVGSSEDVAGAICFLASDAASYITGQVLCIDGGMCMI